MTKKTEKIIETAKNLIDTLGSEHGIPVRFFGSGAIALQCQANISLWKQLNRREINDLDLVTFKQYHSKLREVMKKMGYIEDRRSQVWEKQYGRLLLYHPSGEFPVEVFFTPIPLHHDIHLQHILTIERWTICLTDLVLSKLQYEVLDRKQLIDLTLLFKSHIVGNNECQTICCRRIIESINKDWKLRHTLEKNLPQLKAFVNEKDVKTHIGDPDSVIRKIDTIYQKVHQIPKSLTTKLIEETYLFFRFPIGRPVDYPSPDRWSS